MNDYCESNGHEIKNGRCINCGQVFQNPPHCIEYWTTYKFESEADND